ncbi:MAG: alpha/beta hydrolase family protein [Planctomycetota bacterium]
MKDRFLSPSQYHRSLMQKTEREFAWTGQPFQPWQEGLRERLVELLGGFPDEKSPLDVEELEQEETDDYVRLKLIYTSEECADVPAHLLVPRGGEPPYPAMVCLQGHSPGMHISVGEAHDEHDEELIEGDRDFALQAVRAGFVALAVEQRCFGEREERELENGWDNRCIDAAMHALMLGKTVIGERVWDVVRGIDLLQEQPEVDNDRIACMGNSGGGTATFFAACVEPRIELAVPSCYFCTFADSIMSIQHCPDNYIPGMLQVAEMGELAGLVAPRRMLVVAGREDPIFPFHGVQKSFETAGDIFSAAGCPENLRLVVGEGGHRFYADLAWPVIHELMP